MEAVSFPMQAMLPNIGLSLFSEYLNFLQLASSAYGAAL